MARPTVSVITATYNSSRTLRVALSSLLAQTFTDWEAWIVGDGCTDDSATVVESFQDSRLHWKNLDRNHGCQTFPNNEGLRLAKGPYVAYLGHDDLWMPNHLAELVRHIETTGADLVHSICGLFGTQGWQACTGPPKDHLGYNHHWVPPSCWLHRLRLVETIGYWSDPSKIATGVDTEYLRRISRAGKRIACNSRFTVLKWPSQWIGLYSFQGDPPQEACWRRLQNQPREFEQELIGAFAARLAVLDYFGGCESLRALAREAIRTLGYKIRIATEKWPVFSVFWRWLFRLVRRRVLLRRGLNMDKSGAMRARLTR